MATFVTIGYFDQDGYDRTTADVKQAAHAHDDSLRQAGALMGIVGHPVQVRNPNASGVTTTDGPFLRSDLPIAGFAIIEANTMEEAVEKVSKSPGQFHPTASSGSASSSRRRSARAAEQSYAAPRHTPLRHARLASRLLPSAMRSLE